METTLSTRRFQNSSSSQEFSGRQGIPYTRDFSICNSESGLIALSLGARQTGHFPNLGRGTEVRGSSASPTHCFLGMLAAVLSDILYLAAANATLKPSLQGLERAGAASGS
jgi:hypothetical protein